MTLPKLPREPIRPEHEPEVEKEIWQPKWRCFCCRDWGVVSIHLVKLVIPDYSSQRDKPVACQNPRCQAKLYINNPNYDQRFNAGICIELDKHSHEDWKKTVKIWYENKKKLVEINNLAQKMSLRRRDRTSQDDQEIMRRKQEIEAIGPEEWLEMANQYLGTENFEEFC